MKNAMVLALAAMAMCMGCLTGGEKTASVKVGTYNIRLSPGDKGTPNAWPERKADLVAFVKRLDLDVFGMQEVCPDQAEYLREHLPEFAFVGDHREKDRKSGEASPVFYRKSRFEAEKSGPFWLSETEVRNDQYAVYDPEHDSGWQDQFGKDHCAPGWVGCHRRMPVVRVTWTEARAFCAWFAKKTGLNADLPTGAQWEWAARAGSSTLFPWGGLEDDFSPYANLADKDVRNMSLGWEGKAGAMRCRRPYRIEQNFPLHDERWKDDWFCLNYVARTEPNIWGLYDMHGNVNEWCYDWYAPLYPEVKEMSMERSGNAAMYEASYSGGKAITDPTGPAEGIWRVNRGGCWYDQHFECTATYRYFFSPNCHHDALGFRVALVPIK